ncbi:testis-expressed sequence 10 protein [Quillaja saponaria]|uniref:Testis-expressed sequence 10 protein n=1 Tax=Quillaja saponaria TaxID=32244 RepID=A0AAD7VGC6_QUISA|nr:testis-expressed sequence 10 protein [Quillaja saponaria]KAJ7974886.1 testis-expressed sequence 10 protein [Quillaja saponaria]
MPRSKAPSKKQKKHGVDFKKIKRKIGRKLPPPKNTTNTEIKSKAIILPEQSVASEKEGLAVNKKGLTLKELLQQTSHHNPKVRRDALMGIKDLFLKYPAELKLHKYAVIEKLRERIGDDDKVVRESLYQLLKSVILPGCKEDNQVLVMSLLMSYIFNAMTHLAIDVRLMAFKFFDLVLEFYPPSFLLHAEKILQNYEDILRKNQFYLQDKGKLKNALAGLVHCLSLLPLKKREIDSHEKDHCGQRILHAFEPDKPTECTGSSHIKKKLNDLVPVLLNCFQEFIPLVQTTEILEGKSFECLLYILQSIDLAVRSFDYGTDKGISESQSPHGEVDLTIWHEAISSVSKKLLPLFPLNPVHHLSEKGDDRYFVLNIVIAEIFFQLSEWICPPPDLLEKYLEFIENALVGKNCSVMRSGKGIREKHLVSLLPFIPRLVSHVASDWKYRLLQAFTKSFKESSPESLFKLACLSTIEDMMIPKHDKLCLDPSDLNISDHQIAWIRELPLLLIMLGNKHPSYSEVVLRLQLRLGQCASSNSLIVREYDNMQYSLLEFYCKCLDDGNICYGPFIRLPRESQELSLCCVYYFSYLDLPLLKSIASCCLYPDLDPNLLFRIVEVLHSAYRDGHINIADHLSFFITLLSRFKVFPENIYPSQESDSNHGTFKSITGVLCSCLVQMGDTSIVFQMIEKVILDQILLKPPLDNSCSLLRTLIVLDSKPTRLSDQSVVSLSNFLLGYMIDVVHCIPEDDDVGPTLPSRLHTLRYYLLPCLFLFDHCHKLLSLVLKKMGSCINGSSLLPISHNWTRYIADCPSWVDAVSSVLLFIHKDVKLQQILPLFKTDINHIIQSFCSLQSSEETSLRIEERHKIKCAVDRLKLLMMPVS